MEKLQRLDTKAMIPKGLSHSAQYHLNGSQRGLQGVYRFQKDRVDLKPIKKVLKILRII